MIERDYSFGVIPLRVKGNDWEVYMVQHRSGHWTFPKGHPEGEESPLDAAMRELKEETALRLIRFFGLPPLLEHYSFRRKGGGEIRKTVTYFLGTVEGEADIERDELKDGRWVPLTEAADLATFPEGKSTCRSAVLLILG